ncbi:hypothetical protein OMP43_13905 [Sphingomonas sp. CBMAI 2297]|uniref:hypothetical protein n=1 Tax=Sphingomonas sp. CBMAI 2297 TaxID=2991720 RepID=UPI0024546743|nr:hypothetical protein [Sphingomonas sp. CBMAI 2297]MDH4745111.1 hypothetical protein [Sphingomonas sp. CBMAI 2297]
MTARAVMLLGSLPLLACAEVPEGWATKAQIVEAAERCGMTDFKPIKAGAAWAAYVPKNVSNHAAKEDCIYNDLRGQGLLVTR